MFFAMFSYFLALLILFAAFQESALAIEKSYIVYLGGQNHSQVVTAADLQLVKNSHTELLASFLESEQKAKNSIFYSYKRNINGFAAVLEEGVAAQIARHQDVISVFLNQEKELHTTHSWDFLMLERNGVVYPSSLWEKAGYGGNTIIANLDTGVWPESKSFSDNEIGPIPSRWKGICQFEENETHFCNKKLIGARYFNKGYAAFVGHELNNSYNTPRDNEGHGTHTLSTAAGNFVRGLKVFGVVNGTAKGGSPRAHVASYKVCWPTCIGADVMKAFDTAIDDGVDVLSVSLGGNDVDYFNDGVAISSFHAIMKGIVVVASAGNSGPYAGSVSNVAPWIITVGASTIDRSFDADVVLKNGQVLQGMSLSPPSSDTKLHPLISAAHAAAANASVTDAILCKPGTLDSKMVKDKILVCLRGSNPRVEKGIVAFQAGAIGMIICNDKLNGNDLISDPHILPASLINYNDGRTLFAYVNTTKDAEGRINAPKALLNQKPAPVMAAFSSRGPNTITPEILKPDITAPGIDIIAAFPEGVSPSGLDIDHRRVPFNVMSGTSMACPHVSGVVGLLKTLYPEWSPAAIKSAIMTTARTRDNTKHTMLDSENNKSTPFEYGSGHIQPNRAMDPGLVFDLTVEDYLDFLCGIGYNQEMIRQISNSDHHCPSNYTVLNFNYPSITVPRLSGSITVTRKLKNVGQPGKYKARVHHPAGYTVSVEPNELEFEKIGDEKAFKLTIKVTKGVRKGYSFGKLSWNDGKRYVRSPIVVGSESEL